MPYSVYILYSEKANKYYIGHTEDVNRRLQEHNNPIRNSKFTAKYIPWILLASFSIFETRSEAMHAEKLIKKQKSRKFIEELIENKNNQEKIKVLLTPCPVG